MNSQELETAVRMGLDLVVIVLTDNAYGMIKWKQEGVGFSNFGLDFNNADLVQYANSFGATGHRAESYEHFVEVLDSALIEDQSADAQNVVWCARGFSRVFNASCFPEALAQHALA